MIGPSAPDRQTISQVTRREILDHLRLAQVSIYGRLEELDFLDRVYDLDQLASTDPRRATARGDIQQHRVNWQDWEDDWIFSDDRLELGRGRDEVFLRFLAEMLHPLVRPQEEAEKLAQEFNRHLRVDGWQLVPVNSVSGRSVYGPLPFGSSSAAAIGVARDVQQRLDSAYLGQQVTRLQQAVQDDPELAIGTAKEFLESIAKTVLKAKGVPWGKSDSFPSLVKKAMICLKVVPEGIEKGVDTEQSVKVLVNNLGSAVDKMAEIRNLHGTGHGKDADTLGLEPRHTHLVVGLGVIVAQFLFDSLIAEGATTATVVKADESCDGIDFSAFD